MMADQQTPKNEWTRPVVRRLEGEEAERKRALMMQRNGLVSMSEFETIRRQYLDMRRIASQLAQALERRRRGKPSNSPSVTELVALVEARG